MSPSHAPASGSTDPFPRFLELAGLWSARPRWDELQYALGLSTSDAVRLFKSREELHDFVSRGDAPELLGIQRNSIAHEEQMSAGSSRQLLRWLTELCELHNLTQEYAPHLLRHVPDAHQFTGRTDRPPPSDAACEAYAGQVRALLGQLLAEHRQRAGTPIVTPAGVPAVRAALVELLSAYEDDPIRLSHIQAAIAALWASFGHARDAFALPDLVRRSTALSHPARDALGRVVDPATPSMTLQVWDDGPTGITEDEHRERVQKHDPDESPLRDYRRAIRDALDALPAVILETSDAGYSEPGKSVNRDGVEGGSWVRWKGERHDVPVGNVYKLIAYFWSRDYAAYDELNRDVFTDPVEPQTIRSNLSKTNKVLKKIGIPWKLEADSVNRVARKVAVP